MSDRLWRRGCVSEIYAIAHYYSEKAATYDRALRPPERGLDMERLIGLLQTKVAGGTVLEVACGTGYWTKIIAERATRVKATDINVAMIRQAEMKLKEMPNVSLETADAYSLAGIKKSYDRAFCGFWWSHIPKSAIPCFLDALRRTLKDGAIVIMVDNNYVEGISGPITKIDGEGNTYQTRILAGRKCKTMKNFPNYEELEAALRDFACKTTVVSLKHYWMSVCEVRRGV